MIPTTLLTLWLLSGIATNIAIIYLEGFKVKELPIALAVIFMGLFGTAIFMVAYASELKAVKRFGEISLVLPLKRRSAKKKKK